MLLYLFLSVVRRCLETDKNFGSKDRYNLLLLCNELKHVYNYAPEPQAVSVIFNRGDITVHVPSASVERYRNASHWKRFTIVGDL